MADELEAVPAATSEEANNETEQVVEDVKEEVEKRDDAILEELRGIHNEIKAQTEHHIKHLESHTLASQAPVQEAATNVSEQAQEATNESLPSEPVSLEINEPHDMPKEEQKRKRRKFGKKR